MLTTTLISCLNSQMKRLKSSESYTHVHMWVRAMQAAFCLKATSPCILLSWRPDILDQNPITLLNNSTYIPHLPLWPPHTQSMCFSERFWFIPPKGCWRPGASQVLKKIKKKCVKWLSIPIKQITILVYHHHFTSEKERNKRGWGGVRKLSGEETEVDTAGKCLGLCCSPHWAGVSWAGSLDRSQKWKSIYSEWKSTVCSEHIV